METVEALRVVHLGCGRLGRQIALANPDAYVGRAIDVVSVDRDPALQPDIVADLGRDRLPLEDDSVDVAVAHHVLEHIGRQGESAEWFAFFEELYRILRPDGHLEFESPLWSSVWCWADPTHTRALSEHAFLFFNQDSYRIKPSGISPYRIRCDFVAEEFTRRRDMNPEIARAERWSHLRGILRARKPLRPWWVD
jgi:SAM-dependent methyltransferase